jgi:PAS domain-containing protein
LTRGATVSGKDRRLSVDDRRGGRASPMMRHTPHSARRNALRPMTIRQVAGHPTDDPALEHLLGNLLGDRDEPIANVAARCALVRPDRAAIAWEADSLLYRFEFVSPAVVDVLGYPLECWTGEDDFWLRRVVHGGDRADVIATCALATGRRTTRRFRYRGIAADGTIVAMHVALLARSPDEKGARMRGVMVEIGRTPHVNPAPTA